MNCRYLVFLSIILFLQHAQAQQVASEGDSQAFVPPYDSLIKKLKPAKEQGSLIINVAFDSTYQSYIIENDGKNFRLKGTAPFAISMLNDTFYYVLNRKYYVNEYLTDSLFYDDGKLDTLDTVLVSHLYEYPFISKNIKRVTEQITADKNYKPKILEERNRNWNEEVRFSLQYLLPEFVQANYWYRGYTGGAHANWFNSASILDKNKLFHQPFSTFDLLNNVDSQKFDMAPYIRTATLDSIKRVLYFKGVDGYFDDHAQAGMDLNAYNIHKHDNEQLPALTDRQLSEEGVVNYNDINYLVNRGTAEFMVAAQAFAFAPYAESGDYSFTTSCEAGKLDKRTDPYLSSITMNDMAMVDRNVFDIYASVKFGAVVFQRLTLVRRNGQEDTDNTLRVISMSNPSVYFDLPVNGTRSFLSIEWLDGKKYADLLAQLKDCKYFEVK